jgi:hypothetical protein
VTGAASPHARADAVDRSSRAYHHRKNTRATEISIANHSRRFAQESGFGERR